MGGSYSPRSSSDLHTVRIPYSTFYKNSFIFQSSEINSVSLGYIFRMSVRLDDVLLLHVVVRCCLSIIFISLFEEKILYRTLKGSIMHFHL